jgi:hypothetical protein
MKFWSKIALVVDEMVAAERDFSLHITETEKERLAHGAQLCAAA